MNIELTSDAQEPADGPGTAAEVQVPTNPAEAHPVALSPLTGRDTEVCLLKDRWEQAKEGMGQVVLIVGEAGLGKSRLVHTIREFVLEEADGSVGRPNGEISQCPAIIEWRCSPQSQNTGLFVISESLRRFLGVGEEESSGELFDRLSNHLEDFGLGRKDIVALFAKLLFFPPDERYPAASLTPVREREETFRVLGQWLEACSERRPLLFVVEDLHWIDASTLEFLGQFIEEGLHDRILTVLTFRPEFKTPWPAVAHQTSLALNRLTRRQVIQLMRADAAVPLPDSLVTQILQRTKGVPLLVEEFVRIIGESIIFDRAAEKGAAGDVRQQDIPATLQDLVIARLDRMSSNRVVAQLAATLGREFRYEILAAVASADESMLAEELGKLVDAEILYVKGRPPRCTYFFKHALLEEALHGALRQDERRLFHRQVAETLETRFPETAAQQPELLAQHYTEAGLIEKAVVYWTLSGERSRERFANVEAIVHLTKGLALIEMLPPSPERDLRELELLGPLGTAYIATRGYAAPEVGPVFDRARVLCERLGYRPQLFAMMWGNFAFHIVRGDFRLCADLAEEAIVFGERLQDPGILMEALFLKVLTMFYRGDFLGAEAFCSRSIADYDDRARTAYWATMIGEDSGVTCRCYLMLALWHRGFPDRAQALAAETIALAREINHPFSIAYALHHAGWLYQLCRDGALAQATGEDEIRISDEQGFPFWRASGTLYSAAGMILQGRIGEGLALFEKGLGAYRATGAEIGLSYYLGILAEALIKDGRYGEVRRVLSEAQKLVDEHDEHNHEAELQRINGELLLAQSGSAADAEECFRNAIDTARRQGSRAWELRATVSLALLWRHQGKGRKAFEILSEALACYTEGFTTPDLLDAASLLEDLENERLREDFDAGVKYVRDCIPKPMEGKIAVDWRYIPASTLGGDTVGYHWIDGDHLAFYLIDVTGHGLDSALLSVSLSNVLRTGTLAAADMRQPDQVLSVLNDTFQGRQHSGKFFTIWYGVYHLPSKTLSWSGGGHHPSILISPDQAEPVLLHSSGPMMGVVSGARFPAESCSIAVGARLLIFSDGVFEIRRDKRLVWDLNACIGHVAALGRHPETVMDDLLKQAQQRRGAHQLDDDFSIIEARFQ